jgi:hypothetical protein
MDVAVRELRAEEVLARKEKAATDRKARMQLIVDTATGSAFIVKQKVLSI